MDAKNQIPIVDLIDADPSNFGASAYQNEWIPYFDEGGGKMISAPDIYMIGQQGSLQLIQSVQKDFATFWIVTSTLEEYIRKTLKAKIIHDFGSNVVKPTTKTVSVPFYGRKTLDEVLRDEKGHSYLKAKFNTEDDPDKIKETLTALSGKPSSAICVSIPDQENISIYSRVAKTPAIFGFQGDAFYIGGGGYPGTDSGRSRGVDVNQIHYRPKG